MKVNMSGWGWFLGSASFFARSEACIIAYRDGAYKKACTCRLQHSFCESSCNVLHTPAQLFVYTSRVCWLVVEGFLTVSSL